MLKIIIISLLRNIRRQRLLTLINITGFAVGLSCALLIIMWVIHELSYDKFHVDADRIYQVMSDEIVEGNQVIGFNSVYPLADVLKKDYAQIDKVVRTIVNENKDISIIQNGNTYKDIITYTDPEFFEIFGFKLIKGNRSKLLSTPNSAVITEELALKIFNNIDVLGNELRLKSYDFDEIVTITGVIENLPSNTSLKYGLILPTKLIINKWEWLNNWGAKSIYTYLKVISNKNVYELENQIKNIPGKHHTWDYKLFLHPLRDVHLYSEFSNGRSPSGAIIYVRLFSLAAFIIIIIAIINFINLTTAYSTKRTKDIGVRKVLGASPGAIVRYQLLESTVLSILALIISILIVDLFTPIFNNATGKQLDILSQTPIFYVLILLGTVLTGLMAGLYPALILSRLKPTIVLYRRLKMYTNINWWGKGLLIFQLMVAVIMIFTSITISRQINYIQNKSLGINKENILYFLYQEEIYNQQAAVKNALQQIPEVKSVSYIASNPLYIYGSSGDPIWEGKHQDRNPQFYFLDAGYDAVETLGLEIVKGRSFSHQVTSDTSSFLINETAAAIMDLDNPVGTEMEFWDKKGKIIGIVKDFHHKGFKEAIGPLIIRFWPENSLYCFVRFQGDKREVVEKLRNVYHKFEPEYGFDYHFLDSDFENLYKNEESVQKISSLFSAIAIIISSMGLFGLVAFITERKTKEVGIRKVLGASLSELWNTLARPFITWSLIAIIIATPIAIIIMEKWLNNFAYRTELDLTIFVLTFLSFIFITILTISFKIISTAKVNPVEVLKME